MNPYYLLITSLCKKTEKKKREKSNAESLKTNIMTQTRTTK